MTWLKQTLTGKEEELVYRTLRELLEKGCIDRIRRTSCNSQLINETIIQEVPWHQVRKLLENEGSFMVEKNLLNL